MKNVLIVDIGNTTTKYGIFKDETLVSTLIVSTHNESRKKLDLIFKNFVKENNTPLDGGMVFSVVPSKIKGVVSNAKKYFNVDTEIFDWEHYEYKNKVEEITDKIGADLVADLVATAKYYGGPALIADLGTVNKILLTNENNTFEGCSFTPGMQGSLEYFFKNTALLPEQNKIRKMESKVATNTVDSMSHGVYWSTVGYVNSVYHKLQDKSIKLIITGGNGVFIKDDVKNSIYDKNLTLKGMYLLYKEISNEI